jgi:hypothetical protein
MEAVELSQQGRIQHVLHRNSASLLWTIPLPVHEVLKAPRRTSRIQYGTNRVRRGPLDVQRARGNLPHLRLLERANLHWPEERHMEQGVNAVIGGKL